MNLQGALHLKNQEALFLKPFVAQGIKCRCDESSGAARSAYDNQDHISIRRCGSESLENFGDQYLNQ